MTEVLPKKRLLSLDVLRGITVAGMIVVNNAGGRLSYDSLRHSAWNGMTPCDLVFPFFLFIMGISTYIALRKFHFEPSGTVVWKILKRTLLILLIGIAIHWFDHICEGDFLPFAHLRLTGVLQRIALCYCAASFLALYVPHKWMGWIAGILLVGYGIFLLAANGYVPDETNLLSVIDRAVLGVGHLYQKSPIDPEGLFSTLPSIAHTLIGFCCGRLIMEADTLEKKIVRLFVVGFLMMSVGFLLTEAFPLNKRIWSPTFALTTCGLAAMFQAMLMYFIDYKDKRRWCRFFELFGVNPLFLYVLSEVLAIVIGVTGVKLPVYDMIHSLVANPYLASAVYSLLFMLLMAAAGYPLYKKKIYKVMRMSVIAAIGLFVFCLCFHAGCTDVPVGTSYLSYVDTRVGTAASTTRTAGMFGKNTEEYGQTLPAVLEPNGMNFWTPQTRDSEKKCIAPYYYRDSLFQGFRNSHWIVGGCTQDYGSMTLMPLYGTLRCQAEARATRFSHADEVATPAYYAVTLPDEDILAELTARSRTAIFRFTYQKAGKAYLVVTPNSDEGLGSVHIDTVNGRIYGCNPVHRIYQGWGEPAGFSGHFVVELQKKISGYGTFATDSLFDASLELNGRQGVGAYLAFEVKAGEEVLVKAASSFVDENGAEQNLQAEIPHWNFEQVHRELTDIWERRFNLVQVETDNEEALAKFYGAFYRASFLPRTFNDVDGRYPAFATGIPIMQTKKGQTYYDDYSLWDTYRALHPLVNLITPQKGGEMMQSLVCKYEQGGWMPIFPCWNSYTSAMIGDHVASVVADAWSKGIRNFDINKAYEGLRKNAFECPASLEEYRNGMGRRALDSYLKFGYIPLEDSVPDAFHTCEQVSRTLEYAYDDFALAQIAAALGKEDDYNALVERARNYRHVIDPRTGYVQGRRADGTFLDENNAFRFTRFITEGAPCHYTWYVPQDPYGLMEKMGGKDCYVAKLDSMFSEGRYWHGNEPCHQVAFMFNYAGQPWKTQRVVRHIMDTEYHNTPGGLAGNDDAGQMSAWYMFAAMGFYPVCPGTPYYMLASPSFPSVTLCPEGGRPFTIQARGTSEQNIYIQRATLNGQPYLKNYLDHADIVKGGTLELEMGPVPNQGWGCLPGDCPPEVIRR